MALGPTVITGSGQARFPVVVRDRNDDSEILRAMMERNRGGSEYMSLMLALLQMANGDRSLAENRRQFDVSQTLTRDLAEQARLRERDQFEWMKSMQGRVEDRLSASQTAQDKIAEKLAALQESQGKYGLESAKRLETKAGQTEGRLEGSQILDEEAANRLAQAQYETDIGKANRQTDAEKAGLDVSIALGIPLKDLASAVEDFNKTSYGWSRGPAPAEAFGVVNERVRSMGEAIKSMLADPSLSPEQRSIRAESIYKLMPEISQQVGALNTPEFGVTDWLNVPPWASNPNIQRRKDLLRSVDFIQKDVAKNIIPGRQGQAGIEDAQRIKNVSEEIARIRREARQASQQARIEGVSDPAVMAKRITDVLSSQPATQPAENPAHRSSISEEDRWNAEYMDFMGTY